MQSYFGVAKEEGITSDEVEAIQAIVVAVSGGRVRAQFREARRRAAARKRGKNDA